MASKTLRNTCTQDALRVIAPYVRVHRKHVKPLVKKEKIFKSSLKRVPSLLLQDLHTFLSEIADLPSLLHESVDVLKGKTGAYGCALYLIEPFSGEIYQSQRYFDIKEPRVRWKVEEGTIVAAYVAYKKELVLVNDVLQDERFPLGVGQTDLLIKSVLSAPIVSEDLGCRAVIELFKNITQPDFTEKDMKLVKLVTDWIGTALQQNFQRVIVHKKKELNDYLLSLTKIFIEESIPLEKFIIELVKFMKVSLAAERCAFFLLNQNASKLEADVFETDTDDNGEVHKISKMQLLNSENDIVKLVAQTGESVNIESVGDDSMVQKRIDFKTGFLVRSILCVAVKGKSSIFGVIEVNNKKSGSFSKSDEVLLGVFAKYFSLIIHFNLLHTKLKKKQAQNELNLDLANRQTGACSHDYAEFIENVPIIKLPRSFYKFNWDIPKEDQNNIPLYIYLMFEDCDGFHRFLDMENLGKFILALRNFQTSLLYFNFECGFLSMHAVFNIIKRNQRMFTKLERIALLIASLTQCINRRFVSNNYLMLINHVIYEMYPEESMQNYHYLIVSMLLKKFPIFKNISDSDLQFFMMELKSCMMHIHFEQVFFGKYAMDLCQILEAKNFSNANPHHHYLMKLACLGCGSMYLLYKPYDVAVKHLANFHRDLYIEAERIKKKIPKCIMLPSLLFGHLKSTMEIHLDSMNYFILSRILHLATYIFPNVDEMQEDILHLRSQFVDLVTIYGQQVWRKDDSYVKQIASR